MRTYQLAPAEVQALVAKSRAAAKRPELARITITTVMVEGAGPCAVCRPTTPAQRAAGLADAILTIDANRWADTSEAGKLGIVEHGLCGIAIVLGKSGHLLLDGSGRPRLRRRAFDLVGIGFRQNLKRHGRRSPEHAALEQLRDATGFGTSKPSKSRQKRRESPSLPFPNVG
jgi:hypothetical protein